MSKSESKVNTLHVSTNTFTSIDLVNRISATLASATSFLIAMESIDVPICDVLINYQKMKSLTNMDWSSSLNIWLRRLFTESKVKHSSSCLVCCNSPSRSLYSNNSQYSISKTGLVSLLFTETSSKSVFSSKYFWLNKCLVETYENKKLLDQILYFNYLSNTNQIVLNRFTRVALKHKLAPCYHLLAWNKERAEWRIGILLHNFSLSEFRFRSFCMFVKYNIWIALWRQILQSNEQPMVHQQEFSVKRKSTWGHLQVTRKLV